MKQIILPSTVLEFTWLVIDSFMEGNGLASLSQKWNLDPPVQRVPKKYSQALGKQYENKI